MKAPVRVSIWVGALACTAALAVVSLLPSGSAAPGGWDRAISPGLQNLLHVPAYAGLVMLWLWAVPGRAGARAAWLAAALCAAYGASLEFAQAFVPGRTGSVLDVLLNASGLAVGVLAWCGGGRLSRMIVQVDIRGSDGRVDQWVRDAQTGAPSLASRSPGRASANFAAAKVAAILLVATGHFGVGISLWMPITVALFAFAFASGFFTSAKYHASFTWGHFWCRKLRRLGPHLVGVNVVLLVLFVLQDRSGIWTWQTILGMTGTKGVLTWFRMENPSPFGAGLWFFTLLLLFYAVYPGLRLIGKRRWAVGTVAGTMTATAVFLTYAVPMGHSLWITACGFLVGVWVQRANIAPSPRAVFLVAFVAASAMLALNLLLDVSRVNPLLLTLICLAGALWLKEARLPSRLLQAFRPLSFCVLEIYFLHTYLFVRATSSVAFNYVVSMALVIAVSAAVAVIASATGRWFWEGHRRNTGSPTGALA